MTQIFFPTHKNENFRYVSLHPELWEQKGDQSKSFQNTLPMDWNEQHDDQGCRVLLTEPNDNVSIRCTNSDFSSLKMIRANNSLVAPFKDDYFAQLVDTNDSFTLEIPPNFHSAKAIRVTDLLSNTNSVSKSFLQINVGAGSDIVFFNDLQRLPIAENNKIYPSVTVLQLKINENAKVKFFTEQCLAKNSLFVIRHGATLAKNSKLHYYAYHAGAYRGQHRLECVACEPGAEVDISFSVRAKEKDAIDLWIQNTHLCPNTTSNTKAWNVVDDEATVVFNGMISINEAGHKTEAFQSNKNLLLSDKAQVHTMPKLEIATDDVKCSHGASVASLDADQLFYLKSRGLNDEQARQFLVNAFSFPVLASLPISAIRKKHLGFINSEDDF